MHDLFMVAIIEIVILYTIHYILYTANMYSLVSSQLY